MNHRPKYKVENGKTPRRENLDDLGYGDNNIDVTLKAQLIKKIIHQLDFI